MSKAITSFTRSLVNASLALSRAAVRLHIKALQGDSAQHSRKVLKDEEARKEILSAYTRASAQFFQAEARAARVRDTNDSEILSVKDRVK